jgi:CheY-like chemotaxis protein
MCTYLDLNMPVMDGWGFLDALAPHAPALQGRCRIYLLTSSLALGDREKASENALVQGIMHKPLEEEGIRAILLERDRRPPATAPNIPASRRDEAA